MGHLSATEPGLGHFYGDPNMPEDEGYTAPTTSTTTGQNGETTTTLAPGLPSDALWSKNFQVYYTPDGAIYELTDAGDYVKSGRTLEPEQIRVASSEAAYQRRRLGETMAAAQPGFGTFDQWSQAFQEAQAPALSAQYYQSQYLPTTLGGGQTFGTTTPVPQSFQQWAQPGPEGGMGAGFQPFSQQQWQEQIGKIGSKGGLPGQDVTGIGWVPGLTGGGANTMTGLGNIQPGTFAALDDAARQKRLLSWRQNIPGVADASMTGANWLYDMDVSDATEMIMGAEGAGGGQAVWNPLARQKREGISRQINQLLAQNPQYSGYDLLATYTALGGWNQGTPGFNPGVGVTGVNY